MAEIKTFNFMTLENLTTYHGELKTWVNSQIDDAVASSIKTVSISQDGKTMYFYTVDAPVGEAQAAFVIDLDFYTTSEIDAKVETINGNIDGVSDAVEALDGKVDTTKLANGETVMGRVETAEGAIEALQDIVDELTGGTEGTGSIADAIQDAIDELDLPNTYDAKGAAAAVQGSLNEYITSNNAAVSGKADKATTLAGYGITDAMTSTEISGAISEAVAAEKELREAADGTITEAVGKVSDDLAAYEEANNDRVKAIEDDYLTSADKTELANADSAQVERIAALEGKIVDLTGAMHFEGVKTAVPEGDDLAGYVSGDVIIVGEKEYVFNGTAFVEFGDVSAEGERIGALEGRMDAAEAAISTETERATKAEGDLSDRIDAMDEAYKAADAQVVADMTALVEAEAARAKKAEADAETNAIAEAGKLDAALKTELEGKIKDADDRAKDEEEALGGRIDAVDGKFVNYTNTEGMNKAIADAVKVETERATGEEGKLSGRIDALEAVTHDVAAIDEEAIKNLFK